ncbi:MAG: monovalent cation/H+ antiporter complex subunit F [Acidimicrobiales bacterium]|nr:monovalent cation/H+ antiporter complex subunit F [Acidimicrobiales bacterium]
MTTVVFVVLAVAACCFLLRAVIGPSLADRIVAVDGLIITAVAGTLIHAADRGGDYFLSLAVVASFIGFVGSTAAARFIERRGG